MTPSQLIAEYILQHIQENDPVEVDLADGKKIRGYILDRDLFQEKHNHAKIKQMIHGASSADVRKITIQEIKEGAGKDKKFSGALPPNFDLLADSPTEILCEQVISIRKISQ
jgi:hypothetical protein